MSCLSYLTASTLPTSLPLLLQVLGVLPVSGSSDDGGLEGMGPHDPHHQPGYGEEEEQTLLLVDHAISPPLRTESVMDHFR